jgi:hypothetical protein
MPVEYSFSGNLFRVDFVGSYTPEDVIEAFDAALIDPAFPARPKFLLDVRRSAVLESRRPEEIRMIAEHYAKHADKVGNQCAILATSQIHYGLSSMGKAYAELRGAKAKVFTKMDDALAWLGVDAGAACE